MSQAQTALPISCLTDYPSPACAPRPTTLQPELTAPGRTPPVEPAHPAPYRQNVLTSCLLSLPPGLKLIPTSHGATTSTEPAPLSTHDSSRLFFAAQVSSLPHRRASSSQPTTTPHRTDSPPPTSLLLISSILTHLFPAPLVRLAHYDLNLTEHISPTQPHADSPLSSRTDTPNRSSPNRPHSTSLSSPNLICTD